jgi:RHS repeat-associated protein
VTPDKTYLPLYDGGGNVTGLVDAATGAVVATYEYDPFGNTLSATGDTAALAANPFRFSTKYFDGETGLYYYGYRYYSPQLGRWLTRDPMQEGGGVNVYAFVGNDPVNLVDADGLQPRELQYSTVPRCIACHWTGVAEGLTRVRDLPANYQLSIMEWTRTTGAIDAEVAVNGVRNNPAVAFSTTLAQQLYKTNGERPLKFVWGSVTGAKSAVETGFKFAVIDVPHVFGAWSEQTYREGSGLLPYFQRHADAGTTPVVDEVRQFGRALASADPDTQGDA